MRMFLTAGARDLLDSAGCQNVKGGWPVQASDRIEGQIRGIRGMVENDAYCPDILVQSAAAGAALNAFNKELLASHIRTCVVEDIRDGKDEVIDELVATLQKLMK